MYVHRARWRLPPPPHSPGHRLHFFFCGFQLEMLNEFSFVILFFVAEEREAKGPQPPAAAASAATRDRAERNAEYGPLFASRRGIQLRIKVKCKKKVKQTQIEKFRKLFNAGTIPQGNAEAQAAPAPAPLNPFCCCCCCCMHLAQQQNPQQQLGAPHKRPISKGIN